MWDDSSFNSRIPNGGTPEPRSGAPKKDPTTQVTGLKFDLGFNENATRHYYFTVNGNYAAKPIDIAFKAGNGFTTGQLCGPSPACDSDDPADLPSSLGDRVWRDDNDNGIQDPGEPGVPGITVRLLTADSDILKTTTTDPDGFYTFTVHNTGDLPLSNVRIEDPLVPVSGGPLTLQPGESDTATFTARLTLTAADLLEPDFFNTARVLAETPAGHTLTHEISTSAPKSMRTAPPKNTPTATTSKPTSTSFTTRMPPG